MNFREMRAKLIATHGNFVFFPDDPEVSKVISTRAFTHLVIGEEIVVYAPKAMEEQLEEELEEDYEVVYGEPKLEGEYFISPFAKISHIDFRFKNGAEVLKNALRKPFDEEIPIIEEFSKGLERDFQKAMGEIEMGVGARDLKRIIDCNLLRHADGFSYETIVAMGERAKFPLPKTADERIEEGQIIYIDSSPTFEGYPLSFSRVIFTEQNERWIESLEKINKMYTHLGEFLQDGSQCDYVDTYIRKLGNFPHYSVVPCCGFYKPYAPGDCVIEENMAMTIIPSIYLKEGLIRVKRNVIVKKSSLEFLI